MTMTNKCICDKCGKNCTGYIFLNGQGVSGYVLVHWGLPYRKDRIARQTKLEDLVTFLEVCFECLQLACEEHRQFLAIAQATMLARYRSRARPVEKKSWKQDGF